MENKQHIGRNIFTLQKPPSELQLAFEQIKSPLIYILLFAATITTVMGDILDTAVILLAVAINTTLGFIQERKAQKGLRALKKMLAPTAKVYRNNRILAIDAHDIVENDRVSLSAGDLIPADGILLESVNLFVNEAILTGESMPIEKSQSTDNAVYASTIVTSGRATYTVKAIGMKTKVGELAQTFYDIREEPTALQMQLSSLAKMLAFIVVFICLGIFILGLIRGENLVSMFALAVAIAVSAIPEGMTISLTVILSVGMQRILRKNALVRRLVSAETLGSVSTLCIDKTGTLTEGIMRVVEWKLVDQSNAIKTAVYANNLDNPIDIALWEWVQGLDHYDPQKLSDSEPRIHEIPFDGTKKYMLVQNAQGTWIKGAPEILLEQSALSSQEKKLWVEQINIYAEKGLRILGLAYTDKHTLRLPSNSLTFLGIIGVSDPIRLQVKEAIDACRQSGISVKVVTGDYRVTSESVLAQLGIHIQDAVREIMEGKELEDITLDELVRRVGNVKLFCRVTPDQKLKIVEALQQTGEVVGMTGDGVNDAPALKKADIGIVVATASDLAKDAADLILLDSNFQTIVTAIEEGRVIFDNIKKVVLYLLSDAFTEMILITTSIVANLPLPLTAIHILWINILSDGFPNLALTVESKEYDVMKRKPRRKSLPILNSHLKGMIAGISIVKALIALIAFLYIYSISNNSIHAQTLTFAIIGTGSLVYAFSIRSLSKPIWKINLFKNPWLLVAVIGGFTIQMLVMYVPWLQTIFQTYPLQATDWLIVAFSVCILIICSEMLKKRLHYTQSYN